MSINTPAATTENICSFIQQTLAAQQIAKTVIAVSGGIDSALSLTLLTKTLGVTVITPVMLPYGDQDMSDAELLCQFNGFQPSDWMSIQIKPIVDQLCLVRSIPDSDYIRRGNIMARVRMILVFDLAREKSALVCGTENKSEHYLGYYTRFGDAASDLEPLAQLYKTQVRDLAEYLNIPDQILRKPPSAGLWDNQTDEQELGFSYRDADQILTEHIDKHLPPSKITISGISPETVRAVCARVQSQAFKRVVPYTME